MPTSHIPRWLRSVVLVWLLGVTAILITCLPLARVHGAGNDFNIQVSPSPLVVTLAPGQTQTATLIVRNFSNHSETLQPGLRGIAVGSNNEKVSLNDVVPAGMSGWLHFAPSTLTVEPGQSARLTLTFNTPKDVGFSYAAAMTLTSDRTTKQSGASTAIKPQVVIFCLININRPDARSELSINGLAGNKSRYAFLPADFTVRLHNNGNIISQPSGTLFIQRSFSDSKPIATIPINQGGGYLLPGTSRSFTVRWADGFPVYVATKDGKQRLQWNWKHLNELRLGRYVAKAVLIYNNGHQDVPLIASTTFWVVPWWLILGVAILTVVLVMGLVTWGRLIFAGTKKVRSYAAHRKR